MNSSQTLLFLPVTRPLLLVIKMSSSASSLAALLLLSAAAADMSFVALGKRPRERLSDSSSLVLAVTAPYLASSKKNFRLLSKRWTPKMWPLLSRFPRLMRACSTARAESYEMATQLLCRDPMRTSTTSPTCRKRAKTSSRCACPNP